MADDAGSFSLPLSWVGIDDVPIHFANQFMVQLQPPGEMILTIGQVAPPAVVGTPEEQMAQLKGWPFVAIRPICRYSVSRPRLKELIQLLQQMDENYDRLEGGGQ